MSAAPVPVGIGSVPCAGRGAASLRCSAEPGPTGNGVAMDPGPAAHHAAKSGALRSTRGTSKSCLSALLRAHQIGKPLEQVMRVARAGGGLRVILHREYRLALELDAAIGAVEQRDMSLRRAIRQGRLIHRETVVHRGDFHLAGGLFLDRVIGAVMALMHLPGLGADRQAQYLVTQANTK